MWLLAALNMAQRRLWSICFIFGLIIHAATPAHAGRIEAASVTANNTFGNPDPTAISFLQSFDTVPVVVALSDQQGGDAASIRVTNITTAGFDLLIIEPDNNDGPHIAQNVHYVAVEPGRHVLPDGSVIEAGTLSVTAVQHGSGVAGPTGWQNVSFSTTRIGSPSVISQLQTANSETRNVPAQSSRPHITAIANNLSTSGFDVALERSQANSGPIPSAETIGWIAFPANDSGTFPDTADNTVTWSSVNTPANIRGWQDGCFVNGIGQTAANPIVVAKKMTRNNADGGWFRRCSLSGSNIGLRVEEDRDQDTERRVPAGSEESAAILAFSGAFHALLEPAISVTKVNAGFDNPLGNDFALPGATTDYLITVTNSGNAPPNYDSLVVIEQLPSQLAFSVVDFLGGSGPVFFQEGANPSGLTCNFVSLADMTDCYSFSTDGSNFAYVPSDSGDGTDPAVTHVRISPTGFMAANTGGGSSSFTLRFRAKIK